MQKTNQQMDLQQMTQQFDKAARILLSNKMVIAQILKEVDTAFKDISTEDIINKYIEGDILVPGGLKHPNAKYIQGITNDTGDKRLDICFRVRYPTGQYRIVFMNLEAQGDPNPGYPLVKRGIYYGSCMIADQYGKFFINSHYELIQKVRSIWICPNPPKRVSNTYTRYHIEEKKITGNYHNKKKNYDLIDIDMINLGGKKNERYTGIFKMLDCLLSQDESTKEERIRILKEEFHINIDKDMKGAMEDMCTYGESVYYAAGRKFFREGKAEGRAEGKAEGKAEGRAEGMTQMMLECIRNLMDSMKLSELEAMKQLKVPEEEQAKYEELLK